MARALQLAGALALVGGANAALSVVSSNVKKIQLSMPGDGTYHLAVVDITFNENVFVKDGTDTFSFEEIADGTAGIPQGDDMPPLIIGSAGVATVTCNTAEQTYGDSDGPPDFWMTLPPNDDPASTFLTMFQRGTAPFSLPGGLYDPKRYVLARIIQQCPETGDCSLLYEALDDTTNFFSCAQAGLKVTFPGAVHAEMNPNGRELVDSSGTAFTGDVLVAGPFASLTCDYQQMQEINTKFTQFRTALENASGREEVQGLKMVTAAFEAKETVNGCAQLLQSYVTTTETQASLGQSTECLLDEGQAGYDTDPCCSEEAANTQCCVPRELTITQAVIDTVVESAMSTCSEIEPMKAILGDFQTEWANIQSRLRNERPEDESTIWDRNNGFMNTCHQDITKSCTNDNQCLYPSTQTCDTNSGQCSVNWDDFGAHMLPCILANIPQELKDQYIASWGIADSAFNAELTSRFNGPDCRGPNSWQFRRETEYSQDPVTGDWTATLTAGDPTGCVAEQACSSNPWDQSQTAQSCTGNYCAIQGEQWELSHQGFMDTAQTCVGSVCNRDRQITDPTACANEHECTESCGGSCQSRRWFEDGGRCADLTITSEMDCDNAGHSWNWDAQVCILQDNANPPAFAFPTEADCQSPNVWLACSTSATMDTCDQHPQQTHLHCEWDEWTRCEDEASCLAAGYCDDDHDFEWRNYNTWELEKPRDHGKCVMPYNWDDGWKKCYEDHDNNVDLCEFGEWRCWTRMGCLKKYQGAIGAGTTEHTETSCVNEGGSWERPADTEAECLAHGSGCAIPGKWDLNELSGTDCTSCGGAVESFYNWRGGRWEGGVMEPVEWKTKTWGPVNQWSDGFLEASFQLSIDEQISAIIAGGIKNVAAIKLGGLLPVLEKVACDCGVNGNDQCFNTPASGYVGGCTYICGATAPASNCPAITLTAGTYCNQLTSGTAAAGGIAVGTVFAGSAAVVGQTWSGNAWTLRRLLTTSPSLYEVIRNGDDDVVGQLIGNGIEITDSDNIGLAFFEVCLERNPEITMLSDTYPVVDFAMGHTDTKLPGAPLELEVTNNGLRYCAIVPQPGLYFPILRKAEWKAAGGSQISGSLSLSSLSSFSDTEIETIEGYIKATLEAITGIAPASMETTIDKATGEVTYTVNVAAERDLDNAAISTLSTSIADNFGTGFTQTVTAGGDAKFADVSVSDVATPDVAGGPTGTATPAGTGDPDGAVELNGVLVAAFIGVLGLVHD